jgi:hypothetical protein
MKAPRIWGSMVLFTLFFVSASNLALANAPSAATKLRPGSGDAGRPIAATKPLSAALFIVGGVGLYFARNKKKSSLLNETKR